MHGPSKTVTAKTLHSSGGSVHTVTAMPNFKAGFFQNPRPENDQSQPEPTKDNHIAKLESCKTRKAGKEGKAGKAGEGAVPQQWRSHSF